MRPIFYIADKCRFCESEELELALSLAPSPMCDKYLHKKKSQEVFPLDLYLCSECGLSQVTCVVDPEYIYMDYISGIYHSSSGLINHFKTFAEDVLNRFYELKPSTVLDIGSNEGILLNHFKERGLRVLGVEPAKEISLIANKLGINTLETYFNSVTASQITSKYGLFDIITINNLFANIDNVIDFVEALKATLSPEGLIIIESAYLGDMLKNNMFDFIYHEHLSCITIVPLERLFNKYGMKLVDLQPISPKGGSMRYYFAHNDSTRESTKEVIKYRNIEIEGKFNTKVMFDKLNNNIVEARNDLFTYLINNRNKKIIGYGASATSTTFLYHFGVGSYLDSLVDENIGKIGTFSPGLHLKVYDPEYIYSNQADVIIIIAWRFADSIIEKLKDFKGEIIIPLPEFKIIKSN